MRRSSHSILEGRDHFVSDLALSADLHAHFVRSEVPHAKIREIDLDKSLSFPGVEAVLTAADLQLPPIAEGEIETPLDNMFARPVLTNGVVRFVGKPIAVVLADTERQARDAGEQAWVDFDLCLPS